MAGRPSSLQIARASTAHIHSQVDRQRADRRVAAAYAFKIEMGHRLVDADGLTRDPLDGAGMPGHEEAGHGVPPPEPVPAMSADAHAVTAAVQTPISVRVTPAGSISA